MFNKLKNILPKNNNFILDYNNFKFASDVCFSRLENFTTLDLKDELLDKENSKKEIFSIYWNVFKLKDKLFLDSALIKSSIFVIKPGKIGREFHKSFCLSTKYKMQKKSALFEVLNGEGYFLIETNDKIKSVKIIKVKKSSLIYIPSNYFFTIINSSENENLVCLSLMAKNTRFYPNKCQNKCGSALFYTSSGFVQNKNIGPSYRLEYFENEYLEDYIFDKKKGLYREFIELPEKFNFLK